MGKSVAIQVWENGPYTIAGRLTVNGAEAGVQTSLCRCGASKTKPFTCSPHPTSKLKPFERRQTRYRTRCKLLGWTSKK